MPNLQQLAVHTVQGNWISRLGRYLMISSQLASTWDCAATTAADVLQYCCAAVLL